jgi:hypothetical protein
MLRLSGRSRGFAALAGVFVVLACLRGAWLLHAHSLNSLDGALQTWFAADHFARGEQLGTAFQSYLGITMVLALLPVFVAGGKTLFASTLAAYTMVLLGAFATSYACVWLIRPIPRRARWQVACPWGWSRVRGSCGRTMRGSRWLSPSPERWCWRCGRGLSCW